MAIDPTISLQAKAPDGVTSLRDMMNLRATALSLQKQRATMAADIAQRNAESQSAVSRSTVDAANVNPLIQQQQAQTEASQTQAKQSAFAFQTEQHQKAVEQLTGLIGDESIRKGDAEGTKAAIDRAEQNAMQYGANPDDVKKTFGVIRDIAGKNPQGVQPALINMLRQGLGVGGQAQVIQPSGPQINTGQVQYQANTNPLAAVPVGPVAGTGATNQIPVGTTAFDPNRQAPVIMGPGGSSGPQAGPALGVPQTVEGIVAPVTQDWAATTTAAKQATPNITILQKIKQHAEGAATGYAADKRAILVSLSDYLGIPAGELEKTDTDLLAKNSNMLALTGGNTDSARSLAEMANPNAHMSKDAIRQAADQIIGQQKLVLAKQQYMQKFVNDPGKYTQELTNFNQVGDPQVFEFAAKDPGDQKEMLSKMSAKERQQLSQKMKQLHMMGINP